MVNITSIDVQAQFFENSPTGFFVVDDAFRFIRVNASLARMHGISIEAHLGKTIGEIIPEFAETLTRLFQQILTSGESVLNLAVGGSQLGQHVGPQEWNASYFLIDDTEASRRCIGGVFVDVTNQVMKEQKQEGIERQLRQAQKMGAIGTLAGGMAHDFNNILASLMGYTDLARMVVAKESEAQEFLEQIEYSSLRARDLVQQLLTLSRGDEEFTTSFELQPVLSATELLLRSSIPSTIELLVEIDEECGHVVGDEAQIQQVILNLCTNAVEAIGSGHGSLTISLQKVEVDALSAARKDVRGADEYAHICVIDDGAGMDDHILQRVFLPYFTTKGFSDGAGLGLACVLGIVNSHEGSISCRSKLGEGTTFDVYLPLEKQRKTEGSSDSDLRAKLFDGEREHILVVDDEEMILRVNQMMLEKVGYRVSTCASPLEALSLVDAAPYDFDLLITDQTMPKMTGLELAKKVRVARQDLPIILCTGKCDRAMKQEAIIAGIHNFATKPVSMKDLVHQVRRALDSQITLTY